MLLRRVLWREGAQRTLLAFRTLVCMVADCWVCKNAAAWGVGLRGGRDSLVSSCVMVVPCERARVGAPRSRHQLPSEQFQPKQSPDKHAETITADDLPGKPTYRQTHLKAQHQARNSIPVLPIASVSRAVAYCPTCGALSYKHLNPRRSKTMLQHKHQRPSYHPFMKARGALWKQLSPPPQLCYSHSKICKVASPFFSLPPDMTDRINTCILFVSMPAHVAL